VYGGAFKVTEGFIEHFGADRVMDTPIAEETIVGTAIGSAMEGLRPVAEFQYADFMTSGFDEITTTLARYHYRSGVPLPVVLRAPSGGGVRASNFHSTNPEPWYAHQPGLKVVCPAFPADAKGLLKSAIRDDNPVIFIESETLYNIKGEVPDDPHFTIPLGQAAVRREGTDVTVIAYMGMMYRAMEAAEELEKVGISVEVVDPRTLQPLDSGTILGSVRKTHRAVVVEAGAGFAGMGSELSAVITEQAFDDLDAPVERVTGVPAPMPYARNLEKLKTPTKERIIEAVRRVTYAKGGADGNGSR